jgi:hypothetical protein
MTRTMVFLLEEPSMMEFLESFLPRIVTQEWQWQCIPHQGKSDLEQSIPRKMRAWGEPGVRFIIVRDQDSGDCKRTKKRLSALCQEGGNDNAIIRIACREMESWFLGNLQAVDNAFGTVRLGRLQDKKKYRNPDRLQNPSGELKRLIPVYQKRSGAREIGKHITPEGNRSKSFNVFVHAIQDCMIE